MSTFNPGMTKRHATTSAIVASKMSAVTAPERYGATTESSGATSECSGATTETRFYVMDRSIQSMAATHAAAQQQMDRFIQVMQAYHAVAQQIAQAAHEAT